MIMAHHDHTSLAKADWDDAKHFNSYTAVIISCTYKAEVCMDSLECTKAGSRMVWRLGQTGYWTTTIYYLYKSLILIEVHIRSQTVTQAAAHCLRFTSHCSSCFITDPQTIYSHTHLILFHASFCCRGTWWQPELQACSANASWHSLLTQLYMHSTC